LNEFEIFLDIQQGLPRQGPGDRESTLRALSLVSLPAESGAILDVGCGPGMQTVELAKATGFRITALDFHRPFLEQLEALARSAGVEDRIQIIHGSMFEMDFPEKSFDIIWAEGSIYIAGFEKALGDWKRFLRDGAFLAATHITWFDENPPEEIRDFWEAEYPEITTIEGNLGIIERSGYRIKGHFPLPDPSWWDDYYAPLEAKLPASREKYKDVPEAQGVIGAIEREIEMHRKYSAHYGYVFYVMQKP